MKRFEPLVRTHICAPFLTPWTPFNLHTVPTDLRTTRIALTVHTTLSHRGEGNTYGRILFVHYSSAFNTIVHAKLVLKLRILEFNTSLCNWILDFLTGRPQVVRMRSLTSSVLTLSTGAPQGCVLSPLLYTLFTYDCVATHGSNTILTFADDTTILSLISNNG